MLPRAAELYSGQIEEGLSSDPRAAQSQRVVVRELLDGPVKLMPRGAGWEAVGGFFLTAQCLTGVQRSTRDRW